jgi:hypothetical protein
MNEQTSPDPNRADEPAIPPTPDNWTSSDCLKIFLSHKSTDHLAVEAIKRKLTDIDPVRVSVFSSPSVEHAGSDYREAIEAHLRQSHCVILLYTDSTQQWDWSLYECGYFHGHHHGHFGGSKHKDHDCYVGRCLFIVHREGVFRPKPLENWESIAIGENEIGLTDLSKLTPLEEFLEKILFKKSFGFSHPISPSSGGERAGTLTELKVLFIAAFKGLLRSPRPVAPRFTIEIPAQADWPVGDELPPETVVRSDDSRAIDALGLSGDVPSEHPWPHVKTALVSLLGDSWVYWNRVLKGSLRRLQEGSKIRSGLPLLRYVNDENRAWRPVILEVSRKRDGTWVFHMALADLATELERLPGDDLGTVTRLLWMTRMFTYGIVEANGRRFKKIKGDHVIDSGDLSAKSTRWKEFMAELSRSIDLVYAEAWNTGYEREMVRAALTPKQRVIYDEQVQEWNACVDLLNKLQATEDLGKCETICDTLFDKLEDIARATYAVAGRRLEQLTSPIELNFYPNDEDLGRTRQRRRRRISN